MSRTRRALSRRRVDRAWVLCLAVCMVAVGCATQPHRARQYRGYFATLSAEEQARLSQGVVRLGDSRESVYIALGEPQDRKYEVNDGGVYEEHWIYVGIPREDVGLIDGDYAYVTVNDFSAGSVFARPHVERIHAVFMGETLIRMELLNGSGEPIGRANPRMSLPTVP